MSTNELSSLWARELNPTKKVVTIQANYSVFAIIVNRF